MVLMWLYIIGCLCSAKGHGSWPSFLSCASYITGNKLKRFHTYLSLRDKSPRSTSAASSHADLRPPGAPSLTPAPLSHPGTPLCYFEKAAPRMFDLLLPSTVSKENTCDLVWKDLQSCYSRPPFIIVSVCRDVLRSVVKMRKMLTFDLVSAMVFAKDAVLTCMVWGRERPGGYRIEVKYFRHFSWWLLSETFSRLYGGRSDAFDVLFIF